MSVQPPPVYNTSETIAPLLHLAQYLSPEARALRKAAVAKANIEWRAFNGDARALGILHPMWYPQLQVDRARKKYIEAQTQKLMEKNGGIDPRISKRFQRDFGSASQLPQASSASTDAQNDNISEEDIVEPDNLTQE